MKNKNLVPLIITALFCLLLGFFTGTKYQTTKKPDFVNQFNQRGRNQLGQNQQIQGSQSQGPKTMGGFRPVVGEITASDGKSLTVKLSDGGSKIIIISSTTQINKAFSAQISDLIAGEKISIFGQQNSDGTLVAQNIQLNIPTPNASPSAIPQK